MRAIQASSALKVYISNLMTQPGETRRYTASQHLRALNEHAGRNLFNYILLNVRPLTPRMRRKYAAERAEIVETDLEQIRYLGVEPVTAELLEEDHVARHDSRRLAKLVLKLATQRR